MTVMFRGKPACRCLATWLPVYEAELLRRGVIKHSLDIYQLIGGAKASGGTHATGGAADTAQTSDLAIWVARQMGADASWHRRYNWDGRGGMDHAHLVLRGCPHNGPARYQIAAVDDDYNGLGHLGHGAKDDGPRPLSKRTWKQGIAWAKAQQAEPERIVTANMTWQLNGDKAALLELSSTADILALVECRTKDNKPLDVAAILGPGWDVRQDTTSAARAGSVLAVRKSSGIKIRRTRLAPLSAAGNGVQARYQRISVVRLRGKTVRIIVGHPPVPESNHHEAAANTRAAIGKARAWRKVLRRERLWLWAGDCNTDPGAWAKTLGAPNFSGNKPMCVCWSAGWGDTSSSKRTVAGLDHAVLTLTKE